MLLAATLAESVGADVEHLEAFGVATACAREHIAFGVVLGIANIVGANAREEWRDSSPVCRNRGRCRGGSVDQERRARAQNVATSAADGASVIPLT